MLSGSSGKRSRSDVLAKDVAAHYQAGETVYQVAAHFHVAPSTVLRRLDEAGVARRPRSTPVLFPVDEAIRRVQQDGTTFAQLARDYQVGVDAVRGQLRARGIHAPPLSNPRVLRDIPNSQIAALYRSGLTIAKLAAHFGVSSDTIRTRLRAAGIAARARASSIPAQDVVTLYQQGTTVRALAAAYNVSVWTIYRRLRAAAVTMRSSGPQRLQIPLDEATRLYLSGHTLKQLATRYGVSETIVSNRLSEAGTPMRRKTDRKNVDAELLAALAREAGLLETQ
jgi:uncharacterized protein (DUF433 family)